MGVIPIRVVALDVYGTILAFDDYDYSYRSREGLEDFFDDCEERGIKVVTSSDAFTGSVKNDLSIAFKFVLQAMLDIEAISRMQRRLNINRFDGFFQLDQGVKDFSVIIGHYGITSEELLVVGDNFEKDICGALKVGARKIHCPVYGINQGKEWDFRKIDLDNVEKVREVPS